MDKSTKVFLSRYPELQYDKETKKVRCSLSGHEMPCRLEQLQSYVGGKKFTTLKSHKDFSFQRLEPLIVPSARRKHQLFCALTNRYINRKPNEVQSHLSGKRYKSALEKYNAGLMKLFKERVRKPRQDEVEDSTSTDTQTKVEHGHTTTDSSANLNGKDSEEETESAFWVPDNVHFGDELEGEQDDSETRKLDPEFYEGQDEFFQEGGQEDPVAIEEEAVEEREDVQEEVVKAKRLNRKRKAKLALLQSMKRMKVPRTSMKKKSK